MRTGEIVTLLGANGAGKTTTLKTIHGLMHPRQGKVEFEGKDITSMPAHDLVKLGIAQSPEGRRIFSRLTVLENLQMGGYSRKDKAALQRRLRARLRAVPAPRASARASTAARCPAASSRCSRSAAP